MDFIWDGATELKDCKRRQVMEFVCQFDVREILGQGSFSEIKRCIDKRTRQAFAVKEISFDTQEQRERIEHEIEVSIRSGA